MRQKFEDFVEADNKIVNECEKIFHFACCYRNGIRPQWKSIAPILGSNVEETDLVKFSKKHVAQLSLCGK